MDKLPPLLSSSFCEILTTVKSKYDSKIAEYLLNAHYTTSRINRIFNELRLSDNELKDFSEECLLSNLYTLITSDITMLHMRLNNFEISFLPKGKPIVYNNDKWSRDNRQSGKPIKIIKKLIKSKEFTDRDYEIFHNQLKAVIEEYDSFQIVSGKDITFWYNYQNYYDSDKGTLGSSCMKYNSCLEYFQLYEDNCQMLILTKENKLIGRALLWIIDGKIYMDRIYTYKDHLENVFIEYAKNNLWMIREHQCAMDSGQEIQWLGPDNNYQNLICQDLTIKVREYDHYPYMDTFRYISSNRNYISSNNKYNYRLDSTDGTFESNESYCSYCGDSINEDDLHYSQYYDENYCSDCCIYSGLLDDYILKRDAVLITTDYGSDYAPYNCNDIIKIDNDYYDKDYSQIIQLGEFWNLKDKHEENTSDVI